MAGSGIFLFAIMSRLAVESIQGSIQWVPRVVSLSVKQRSMKFTTPTVVKVISNAVKNGGETSV
jgi:hypothetical protein